MTKQKIATVETRGHKVIRFIEELCLIPEGAKVGQKIVLESFQKRFILDIYDNPHGTRKAILSLARKNGKSALIACLLLCHIVGCERKQNSQIVSGAMSREQASLIFSLAVKMLELQPAFTGLYQITPSKKIITGLKANVEYKALSADGTTAHGLSPVLALLDEVGQIRGAMTPFVEAITTSQGAYENPLLMMISTQAPSDSDFLSIQIDDALRSGDKHTVCHLYCAAEECDMMDESQWAKANPALGLFRSKKDLEEQLKQASRIPSMESSVRNLLLNQRIAMESLWLAPRVWKECCGEPDLDIFRSGLPVAMGLDLSSRNDLTAVVLACKDTEGVIHLLPFGFTPMDGVRERQLLQKIPYETWINAGQLIAVPNKSIDYDWVCEFMKGKLDDLQINVTSVFFDRWRINEFKGSAERTGFCQEAEFIEVGQGYQSMSPRVENFETLLLNGKIRHGNHALLNLGASTAIVVRDPSGNRKLDKGKSGSKIDALVAGVMAVGGFMVSQEVDVEALIG